mmetsp:Transcript_7122/g.15574  ORF Transcript_7122/g.15574 Transcript_7122/m.15574 type:complete len:246 (+) Transcript_7122:64-801(+)
MDWIQSGLPLLGLWGGPVLAQLLGEHGTEVSHHLVLLLLLLLEGDERKSALLLRGVHLVLLAQTHGIHLRVSGATHHIAYVLQTLDLLPLPADLTSARDAHVILHVLRDGVSLPGHERVSVVKILVLSVRSGLHHGHRARLIVALALPRHHPHPTLHVQSEPRRLVLVVLTEGYTRRSGLWLSPVLLRLELVPVAVRLRGGGLPLPRLLALLVLLAFRGLVLRVALALAGLAFPPTGFAARVRLA